jgi:hypothetical protein
MAMLAPLVGGGQADSSADWLLSQSALDRLEHVVSAIFDRRLKTACVATPTVAAEVALT